jgi:hypothetical protein
MWRSGRKGRINAPSYSGLRLAMTPAAIWGDLPQRTTGIGEDMVGAGVSVCGVIRLGCERCSNGLD